MWKTFFESQEFGEVWRELWLHGFRSTGNKYTRAAKAIHQGHRGREREVCSPLSYIQFDLLPERLHESFHHNSPPHPHTAVSGRLYNKSTGRRITVISYHLLHQQVILIDSQIYSEERQHYIIMSEFLDTYMEVSFSRGRPHAKKTCEIKRWPSGEWIRGTTSPTNAINPMSESTLDCQIPQITATDRSTCSSRGD